MAEETECAFALVTLRSRCVLLAGSRLTLIRILRRDSASGFRDMRGFYARPDTGSSRLCKKCIIKCLTITPIRRNHSLDGAKRCESDKG